jgi:hypothetical protein
MRKTPMQTGLVALVLTGLAACASTPREPAPITGRSSGPSSAARYDPPPMPPLASAGEAERPRRGHRSEVRLSPRVLDARAGLQCVPYARSRSGIQIFGDAVTWWRQAQGRYATTRAPEAGAVLAVKGYRDPTRGHVAFVTHVLSSRMIVVDQANWLNSEEITVEVPIADVSPEGDWSRIRIWHVPGGHWGGRIYEVEGFILARPAGQGRNGRVTPNA